MCPGVEARFNVAPPTYVCDKPFPVPTLSPDGGWTLDANKKGVGLLSEKHWAQSVQPLPEATPASCSVAGSVCAWSQVAQASTCAGVQGGRRAPVLLQQ